MFDPPPGFDDMLADAQRVPLAGEHHELDVPQVGMVLALNPMPGSAAALAMAANAKIGADAQQDYITLFVRNHVGEPEYERLLVGMMAGDLPLNTVARIARAIATWGTARPYVAVITLALTTATHWRLLRHRITSAGVQDPIALPSMHALLDFTEAIVLDSFTSGDHAKDTRDRTQFLDRLYGPESVEARDLNGDTYTPVPAGFDDPADVEASFDAFAAAAAR